MTDPILITGCARSGTSLTAGIVEACGAFGGKMSGATNSNEKGMFENEKIKKLVKSYLRSAGADPMGQYPLPTFEQLVAHPFPKLNSSVISIMEKEGYKKGPWFYKCAKACLMWYLWDKAFPKAKWIIVRRNSDEIINSCLEAHFMKAYEDQAGWQTWIDAHQKLFWEICDSLQDSVMEVWPAKAIDGDLSEMQDMIKFLGLKWNDKKVQEFIDPELWHVG